MNMTGCLYIAIQVNNPIFIPVFIDIEMKILSTIFLISVCISISCSKEEDNVKYEVICNPPGFWIEYKTDIGATLQEKNNSGSWSYTFIGKPGDWVYLWAKAYNENSTISTKIYYQGQVIEQSTKTGDFASATAAGTIP
jgi:hypothetical protein